jgi:bifunctional UDP-N-acetylglucosamine pyrophosphorylase/glucosamine-1-phosphate N-acetyltransferase
VRDLISIILAAGEGKRMKSKHSKVTHRICGKTLIEHVVDEVAQLDVEKQIVIVGHRADQVQKILGEKVEYVVQEEQNGTAHAVLQAYESYRNHEGDVLILCGDTPLITANTLSSAFAYHRSNENAVTVITTNLENPKGYGRIVRDDQGNLLRIVECRDASESEYKIREVNSGMYLFNAQKLTKVIQEIESENSQGEYYLTDTIELVLKESEKVGAFMAEDSSEMIGINDRVQLALAGNLMKERIMLDHMRNGVTIIDPNNTIIDKSVRIGMDTIIHPYTEVCGETEIGEDCEVGMGCRIVNSKIASGVTIDSSYIVDSQIDCHTKIGPFAYLRPKSRIGQNVKIGDFVEVKNTVVGDNTKISHLTYVGDAEVGKGVNLGCGVVVVNYDGHKKHKCMIKDNAFVGCNVNLVSPVEVEENAFVAAGSTITKNVPQNSLAIARAKQKNIKDWVTRKKTHVESK